MGYHTDFDGSLSLSRELTEVEQQFIEGFANTRRCTRNAQELMDMYGGKHGNPMARIDDDALTIYGKGGQYFAIGGLDDRVGVVDVNKVPKPQPGLWCQWIVNEDNELEWDGNEKFYNYTEWLQYLVKEFFSKWGVILNGEIEFRGEEFNDTGIIHVKDNVVREMSHEALWDEKQKQKPTPPKTIVNVILVRARNYFIT